MTSSEKWGYFSFNDLVWAKALVSALASARSVAGSRLSKEDDKHEAAYRTPAHGYVVKYVDDSVARIACAAFVQCLVTKERPGYGQILHRLPKGSRRVFPKGYK